jgi:hypothetical protein
MTIFPPGLPGFSSLANYNLDIIGQAGINQIFLLQKRLFSYKLNYYKSGLFLKLEVTSNGKLLRISLRGCIFRQEVYFEEGEFLDRIFWQEVPVHRCGIDFVGDSDSVRSGSAEGK